MSNLETELKAIKQDIAAKTEQRIRAETEKELAEQEIETGLKQLYETFNCESIDAARKLQVKLESVISEKITEIRSELDNLT